MGATTTRKTACRICAVGCGTLVDVETTPAGERVVAVSGDPDDPYSHGYTCSKGRAGPDFHQHADRLDRPQRRVDGRLVDVTWDDTLDDIAARLGALIDERGGGVVAHYLGTGGPLDPSGVALAEGFFRAVGTEQRYTALSIDCPSKFLVPQLVAGVQLGFQPDLDANDVLVAVGVNPVVSHGHGMMTPNPLVRLRALRDRGGLLVVLDPRRTETAAHADLHLQVRPGTDHAVLAFAVREALRRGADAAYLATAADPASVERLRRLVEPFDAVRVAADAGVAAADLHRFADIVCRGRLGIETGTGVSMARTAMLTEWMAWALAAVTGSLDRRGGCTFNPGFLRPLEDALPAGRGDLGPRPTSRPDLPRIVTGEMPCAALADEIEAGEVRALFVRVGNPALTFPDNRRLRAALQRLELLVVIDARPTETTRLATHVLPMADHFERSDLVTGYLQADPFLRWAPAVVAPLGERRPQWWMFAELARRCGFPLFGSERRAAALAGVELDDEVIAAAIARGARHEWEAVRAEPYGIVDRSLEPGWLIPGRLPRALDLAPTELEAAWERLAVGERPPDTGLVLVNRRTGGQYNSLTAPINGRRARPSAPTLLIHPADADARGLADGAAVTVRTEHGACRAALERSPAMRRGVVSLPHAWPDADVNRLTSATEFDPLSGMPTFSGLAVTIEPDAPGERTEDAELVQT